MPGQRADGSFEVSASKTFPLEQRAALDGVVAAVTAGLGQAPTSESRTARYATARWKLGQGGSLLATANPTKAGRTSVSLTRQGVPDAAALGPAMAEAVISTGKTDPSARMSSSSSVTTTPPCWMTSWM